MFSTGIQFAAGRKTPETNEKEKSVIQLLTHSIPYVLIAT